MTSAPIVLSTVHDSVQVFPRDSRYSEWEERSDGLGLEESVSDRSQHEGYSQPKPDAPRGASARAAGILSPSASRPCYRARLWPTPSSAGTEAPSKQPNWYVRIYNTLRASIRKASSVAKNSS